MKKYYGWYEHIANCRSGNDSTFRFRVDIPTTIFDTKSVLIRVYNGRGSRKEVKRQWMKLHELPRYNTSLQTIVLSREDSGKLNRFTSRLIDYIRANK